MPRKLAAGQFMCAGQGFNSRFKGKKVLDHNVFLFHRHFSAIYDHTGYGSVPLVAAFSPEFLSDLGCGIVYTML